MKRSKLIALASGATLAAAATGAWAAETITYRYDARGRLIVVARTGTVNKNTTVYAYDKADNRTAKTSTSTQ